MWFLSSNDEIIKSRFNNFLKCAGQKFALLEEKTILSTIFRNFYVKSLDKREDIALVFELVLKSNDGIRLHFTPREKNA